MEQLDFRKTPPGLSWGLQFHRHSPRTQLTEGAHRAGRRTTTRKAGGGKAGTTHTARPARARGAGGELPTARGQVAWGRLEGKKAPATEWLRTTAHIYFYRKWRSAVSLG